MIASGVIVAVVAAGTPWLLWAVAFAVLFLIFLVLSRIEKRLAALEEQGTRRSGRRRTPGGAGHRHRA